MLMKIPKKVPAWSDEAITSSAIGYKAMPTAQYAKRVDTLAADGEAAYAKYLSELQVPPFILRALREGDSKTLARYAKRRAAEFDFKQWADAQGVEL